MANYEYNWANGVVTSIPKPTQQGFNCDYKSPSGAMNNAVSEILAHAGDGDNLNDKEQYCQMAHSWITGLVSASKNIRDGWDSMENDCHHWRNVFRWCEDKGRYCYMTENELESAEASWRAMHNTNVAGLTSIMNILQETSTQITLDGGQATAQAILDQLIAETNNIISIAAYQNESKQLDLGARKTRDIFLPIIIGLVILGVGFYMLKK